MLPESHWLTASTNSISFYEMGRLQVHMPNPAQGLQPKTDKLETGSNVPLKKDAVEDTGGDYSCEENKDSPTNKVVRNCECI